MIKKIYTILVLLFNLVVRRKHYKLHFVAENDPPIKLWYYDFPHWGFDKHNLLMVSGADTLCELYAQGNNEVTVDIIASRKKLDLDEHQYDHYEADDLPNDFKFYQKIIYGRDYHAVGKKWITIKTFWICPVTLFVLGRYPKHIYIQKINYGTK
jgi:hypothetical protein